jgi:hypothetical protein
VNRWNQLALALVFLLASLTFVSPAYGQTAADESLWFEVTGNDIQVHLYFFWSKTCPHCQEARPFIEALPAEIPWLNLHSLELTEHPDHVRLYVRMASTLGQEARFVPAFLFCGAMTTGYDRAETTGQAIKDGLTGCYDQMLSKLVPQAGAMVAAEEMESATKRETTRPSPAAVLPFLGEVNVQSISLPTLTFVLAGLDAFNPCAFFVLMFLLSIMIHAQSRWRMMLIGGVFVFFSGFIYFIFMAAWLNVFLMAGELRITTLLAGIMAIAVALLNIKDYFWFKQGVSLSIPEGAKPNLYRRARNLLKASSLPAMLFGTAILAIAANSYELLCTSGFPMVYTRVLTLSGLPTGAFYAYLATYNLIYVIPLFLIVLVFSFKFSTHRLTEQEGRVLKLLSGLMMLMLGVLLVAAPEMLNQATTASLLLLIAIAATLLIVAIRSNPSSHTGRARRASHQR